MKAYRKFAVIVSILLVLIFLSANAVVFHLSGDGQKFYRVEIARAAEEIAEHGLDGLDLQKYSCLTGISRGEGPDFIKGGEEAYALREIKGELYRFDYKVDGHMKKDMLFIVNLTLGAGGAVIFLTLYVLWKRILQPFDTLRKLPVNLAKGNLTMPVLQQKNRYFGEFLWGMDLLREKLEYEKKQELKLQKEKKSLILSLAHDIKTPLAAIKLYSQALSRNLYQDPEKQAEVSVHIGEKVDEIEAYLQKIMTASREDFLHLQVHMGEFYVNEVRDEITNYYREKLELLKIPFTVDFGENCLLQGDKDRVVEIFQNLMENAVKYGGGGAVSISASEEGGSCLFTVSNENCSLKAEELPHIFDSFWRGGNSERVQGSGLGLYICRELIRAMGGEIFAEIRENRMEVCVVLEKI